MAGSSNTFEGPLPPPGGIRDAPLPLAVLELKVRCFRNLGELSLVPGEGLNVIAGDNGQGKTSLLEAIYQVATTKSFRSEKLVSLVQTGAEQASVVARIREGDLTREQRTVFGRSSRIVRLDGKAPSSLGHYATRTPVVVFHPADLELVSGAAGPRRKLLDRVALFVDPPGASARLQYTRALRSRQRVLEERGVSARELDAFETVLAEEGSRYARAQEQAFGALHGRLGPALERLAAPETRVGARFVPGGPGDPAALLAALRSSRARDSARGSASVGPHRNEIELEVDGRAARGAASQGQQRLIALALKLSELECVRAARGAHPILLLDDVSSELDESRTAAVYGWLCDSQSQVFVTTTREDLFPAARARGDALTRFFLVGGRLEKNSEPD